MRNRLLDTQHMSLTLFGVLVLPTSHFSCGFGYESAKAIFITKKIKGKSNFLEILEIKNFIKLFTTWKIGAHKTIFQVRSNKSSEI
jgi:hypothetical protein